MIKIQKLSPILVVNEIEPCIEFWQQIGFEKTIEILEGAKLGFLALEKDGVEIMYQSLKSIKKDLPAVEKEGLSKSFFYIKINGIDAIQKKFSLKSIVVPLRKTFYGALEVFVREPGGNIIGFSEKI